MYSQVKKDSQLENNEEFAKLDALLADLLSEVEQPILLNQHGTTVEWNTLSRNHSATINNTNKTNNYGVNSNKNDNCEILKNLDDIERSVDYLNVQKEKLKLKKNSNLISSSYRQKDGDKDVIFEEEDQHDSSSLNNLNQPYRKIKSKFDYYVSNSNEQRSNKNLSLNKKGFSYTNPNSFDKLHKPSPQHYHEDEGVILNDPTLDEKNFSPSVSSKPPLSPNMMFTSPNRFTNNALTQKLENEDDIECSSIKSGVSTASTVQRSKYHTISNNYVDSTRPQFTNGRHTHNKRAFSAPPVDMGKIVLQRIELKSPLTIPNSRNTPIHSNGENEDAHQNVVNRYNNRNVFKSSTLQPHYYHANIRAASERPQISTPGYDTDTGVFSYNHRSAVYRNNVRNNADFDSDTEGFRIPIQRNSSNINANINRYHDGSGYDTDTGLMNARKSLNQRLMNYKKVIPSRSDVEQGSFDNTNSTSKNLVSNPKQFNMDMMDNRLNQSVNLNDSKLSNRNNLNGYEQNVGDTSASLNHLFSENRPENRKDNGDSANSSAFHSINTKKNTKSINTGSQIFKSLEEDIGLNQISNNDVNPSKSENFLLAVNSKILDNKNVKNQTFTNAINSRSSSVLSVNDRGETKPWKVVEDNQNFWYKPKISREDAISLLKDKTPGTFLIRDSNNFPNAYGLALKVEKLPPNIPIKPNADQSAEFVRHFLIEPTTGGVRIKGCCNEPIFTNLAALVYQHSLIQLALPCKLILPSRDLQSNGNMANQDPRVRVNKQVNSTDSSSSLNLLEKGAACHIYYLNTLSVENLMGPLALSKAIEIACLSKVKDNSQLTLVQFKVNSQGIFITDINRKKFTRNHLPTNNVLFCAIEESKIWPKKLGKIEHPRIFGVISKSQMNDRNNECHIFVELDPEQPAIAIVDFINRYLIPSRTN